MDTKLFFYTFYFAKVLLSIKRLFADFLRSSLKIQKFSLKVVTFHMIQGAMKIEKNNNIGKYATIHA